MYKVLHVLLFFQEGKSPLVRSGDKTTILSAPTTHTLIRMWSHAHTHTLTYPVHMCTSDPAGTELTRPLFFYPKLQRILQQPVGLLYFTFSALHFHPTTVNTHTLTPTTYTYFCRLSPTIGVTESLLPQKKLYSVIIFITVHVFLYHSYSIYHITVTVL